jgi:hypothetical protein
VQPTTGKSVHELNLIRAAAEDVAAARVVLSERSQALKAIVRTALDHGAVPTDVARASEAALPTAGMPVKTSPPVLTA